MRCGATRTRLGAFFHAMERPETGSRTCSKGSNSKRQERRKFRTLVRLRTPSAKTFRRYRGDYARWHDPILEKWAYVISDFGPLDGDFRTHYVGEHLKNVGASK